MKNTEQSIIKSKFRECVCPYCEKNFTTKHPTKIYCTPKCRSNFVSRSRGDKQFYDDRKCQYCRSDISFRRGRAIYCSRRCANKTRSQPDGISRRFCLYCEKDISWLNIRNKFCSNNCCKLYRGRKNLSKKEYEEKLANRFCGTCGKDISDRRSYVKYCCKDCLKIYTGTIYRKNNNKPFKNPINCEQCGKICNQKYKNKEKFICKNCFYKNREEKDGKYLCQKCNKYFSITWTGLCSNCYKKTFPYVVCDECGEYKQSFTKNGNKCSTCTRRNFKVRRDICAICEKMQFISGTHEIGKICIGCWQHYKLGIPVEIIKKIRKRKQCSRQLIVFSFIQEMIECEDEKFLQYLIPNCPRKHKQKRYDIYISDLKQVIEVHEEQHYSAEGWSRVKGYTHKDMSVCKEKFDQQVETDRIKKELASESGYSYFALNVSDLHGYEQLREKFEEKLGPYIRQKLASIP